MALKKQLELIIPGLISCLTSVAAGIVFKCYDFCMNVIRFRNCYIGPNTLNWLNTENPFLLFILSGPPAASCQIGMITFNRKSYCQVKMPQMLTLQTGIFAQHNYRTLDILQGKHLFKFDKKSQHDAVITLNGWNPTFNIVFRVRRSLLTLCLYILLYKYVWLFSVKSLT